MSDISCLVVMNIRIVRLRNGFTVTVSDSLASGGENDPTGVYCAEYQGTLIDLVGGLVRDALDDPVLNPQHGSLA